jgi:hypothetical protein
MCGNNIVRAKTELNRKITEPVSEFKYSYLGSILSNYNTDKDLEYRIQTLNKMNGVIRRSFGKKMTKETGLRLYNVTYKAALKWDNENWILKQRCRRRLEAAQMKFLRAVFGLTTLEKIRNTEIRARLDVKNIFQETEECRSDWVKHVERMGNTSLPQQAQIYKPTGKIDRGRPRIRWRDEIHLER